MKSEMNVKETKTQETKCSGGCNETLCWNCKYASGQQLPHSITLKNSKTGKSHTFHGCPWVSNFVAVPGWDAEKTIVKNRLGNEPSYQDSYNVKSCPLFEESERKEVTIDDIINDLGLPVRYALSNRLILWDYYDIYRIFVDQESMQNKKKLTGDEMLKIKIAAIRGFVEDLEFDLDDNYITQEEFDQKLNLIEVLEETIKKYHYKTVK